MMIRTVLGDISPADLGVTYMHEHLIIDSEIVRKDYSHIHLPSVEDAVKELQLCKEVNVGAMLDCMPSGSGRDVKKLAAISSESNIHIIATTGLHHKRYYEESNPVEYYDVEELAKLFISEIVEGCENTTHKAGVIKVVTSGVEPTQREIRLFEAAALAHEITGAPILSHCEHGTGAIQQIELFSHLKVNLNSVVLSHTDKEADIGYHREILGSGVNVEYDQSLRQIDLDDPISALLTVEMMEQGFSNQIMLGTDGARRTLWRALNGEPGLFALYKSWSDKLRNMGIADEQLDLLFIDNPARFLQFKEVKSAA